MKWRHLIIGVAGGMALVGSAYYMENGRGQYAWAKWLEEARARGEPMEAAEVVPPPVPEAENFAMAPAMRPIFYGPAWDLKRLKLIQAGEAGSARPDYGPSSQKLPVDLMAWQSYYRNSAEFRHYPDPSAAAEEVLYALGQWDEIYLAVREAADRLPRTRFPLEYSEGVYTLMPHLPVLLNLNRVAWLRAVAAAHLHRGEDALAETRFGLRLARANFNEPMLLCHQVAVESLSKTLDGVWEGLARHTWNEAQLAAVETELATFNVLADYRQALQGERRFVPCPCYPGTTWSGARPPAACWVEALCAQRGSLGSGLQAGRIRPR